MRAGVITESRRQGSMDMEVAKQNEKYFSIENQNNMF